MTLHSERLLNSKLRICEICAIILICGSDNYSRARSGILLLRKTLTMNNLQDSNARLFFQLHRAFTPPPECLGEVLEPLTFAQDVFVLRLLYTVN